MTITEHPWINYYNILLKIGQQCIDKKYKREKQQQHQQIKIATEMALQTPKLPTWIKLCLLWLVISGWGDTSLPVLGQQLCLILFLCDTLSRIINSKRTVERRSTKQQRQCHKAVRTWTHTSNGKNSPRSTLYTQHKQHAHHPNDLWLSSGNIMFWFVFMKLCFTINCFL